MAFSCLATVVASASVDRASQEGRWGSGHPSIVPYSAFPASDGFVVLGAINELMWERLCEAFELHHLREDERAAGNEARVHNRAFVEDEIAAVIAPLTAAEVTARLKRANVLVAPVRRAAEAIDDPQVAALGLVDEIDGVRFTRTPLSQFNRAPLAPAPPLGRDSETVLGDLLSLNPDELSALVASGVVHTAGDAVAADGAEAEASAAKAATT
jgi:crotonobetainyl-CoA:carnitine CoA-transferase CaiB-like acyl-CoA transferase